MAFLSVPMGMGYAQVAGLPAIYGLYSSFLPILFFGLITTSKNFVFGVDAAPAALVGGALVTLGVQPESAKAMELIPFLTFLVALWLFVFAIVRAGRIVRYISTPVVGGFVTGICSTIILMQIPKLFGGTAGIGELDHLILHILECLPSFHWLSFLLGLGTIGIIRLSEKFFPKFPVQIFVMIGAGIAVYFGKLDALGVKLLGAVPAGLGRLRFVIFDPEYVMELLPISLSIAVVIMTETLLASQGNARKDREKLNPNREILGYAMGNMVSAFLGSCPVNGSVSRSSVARQYRATSQILSVTASVVMLGILMFLTPWIAYLPIPVLTGIIICALLRACEFDLLKKLFRTSRKEGYIFLSAWFGVLLFGTVYGVVIGVVLSFVAVVIQSMDPPREFLGIMPDGVNFENLKKEPHAREIPGVKIYRFAGHLFFGNVDVLEEDLRKTLTESVKCVILDASGITNVDVTGAERLKLLGEEFREENITFYLTGHSAKVNEMLFAYGAGQMVREGMVRRNILSALHAAGYEEMLGDDPGTYKMGRAMAEFRWAFGKDWRTELQNYVAEALESLEEEGISEHEPIHIAKVISWGEPTVFDEEELLDQMEVALLEEEGAMSRTMASEMLDRLRDGVELRRLEQEKRLLNEDPRAFWKLYHERFLYLEKLKRENGGEYRKMAENWEKHLANWKASDPYVENLIRQEWKEF